METELDQPSALKEPSAPKTDQVPAPEASPRPLAEDAQHGADQRHKEAADLRDSMQKRAQDAVEEGRQELGSQLHWKVRSWVDKIQGKRDLSRDFNREADLPPVDEQLVREWTQSLRKYRVIVLRSQAYQVLKSAVTAIIDDSFLKARSRAWIFDTPEFENESVFGLLAAREATKGPDEILVMYAYQGNTREFLNSLPEDPCLRLGKELEKREAWMVILTTPNHLLREQTAYEYVEEEIPWIPSVLRSTCPEEQVLTYEQKIRELPAPWPYNWKETRQLAKNGNLSRELDRLADPWDGTLSEAGNSRELDDDPLENAIRFVACYFGGSNDTEPMSPEDFQRVLLGLLKGQTTEEMVESTADDGKRIQKPVTRKLEDLWSASRRQLLEKCAISVVREKGEAPYIDFTDPGLRFGVLNAFQTDHIWTFADFCQRLQGDRLLFDSKRSVRRGAVRLIQQRLASDSKGFGQTFLTELVANETAPFSLEVRQGLDDLLDALIADENLEAVRLSLLEMMEKVSRLEAWRLALRLRSAPQFQSVFSGIFRRSLDEGGDTLREEALGRIFAWIEQMSAGVIPTVQEVFSWGTDVRLSPSAPSRRFAFDLAFNLLAAQIAPDPSASPFPAVNAVPEWVDPLVKLLLDRGLDECFEVVTADWVFLSIIITWMMGLRPESGENASIGLVRGACITFPLVLRALSIERQEIAEFFRVMVITEWTLKTCGQVEASAQLSGALQQLHSEKPRKRQMQELLEVLGDAAAEAAFVVDQQVWELPADRQQRTCLRNRLRGIRDATRRARNFLSNRPGAA